MQSTAHYHKDVDYTVLCKAERLNKGSRDLYTIFYLDGNRGLNDKEIVEKAKELELTGISTNTPAQISRRLIYRWNEIAIKSATGGGKPCKENGCNKKNCTYGFLENEPTRCAKHKQPGMSLVVELRLVRKDKARGETKGKYFFDEKFAARVFNRAKSDKKTEETPSENAVNIDKEVCETEYIASIPVTLPTAEKVMTNSQDDDIVKNFDMTQYLFDMGLDVSYPYHPTTTHEDNLFFPDTFLLGMNSYLPPQLNWENESMMMFPNYPMYDIPNVYDIPPLQPELQPIPFPEPLNHDTQASWNILDILKNVKVNPVEELSTTENTSLETVDEKIEETNEQNEDVEEENSRIQAGDDYYQKFTSDDVLDMQIPFIGNPLLMNMDLDSFA
jgi:hypothetical protein